LKKIVLISFSLLLLVGCQSTNNRVSRVSSDLETDLSGRWNDTDSRLVSEAMVEELLSGRIVTN